MWKAHPGNTDGRQVMIYQQVVKVVNPYFSAWRTEPKQIKERRHKLHQNKGVSLTTSKIIQWLTVKNIKNSGTPLMNSKTGTP